ncbi:hypothetical protein J5N97_006239 [Dioscorea zingiberensis]|uniref:Uncharacterized protein n=1 Tax=Dioscorea zingiberensis TaxID=325984 RepID=A0A9D5D9U3_9LILI|nr:hypothetical protein J5N97_006239 [Dioscorea zingiberensis]
MTMKRKSSVLDDDLKSVGTTPRLVRQKNIASSTLYRAGLSDVQKSLPYFSENFEILEGNASIFQRNIEHSSPKGSNGNLMMSQPSDRDENRPAFISGSSTVHPQSSEIARKILDHINRTVHSPKEKALELKTAITRTVVHSDSTTLILDSKENPPVVNSTDNQFADCLIGRATSAQESVDTLEVPERQSSRQSVGKDLLSSYSQGTPFAVRSAEPWPHFSAHESVLKSITDSILSEEPKLSDESSKPSDDGTLTIFDNVSGFTFPITVDSVASSEPPPTPTLFSFVATGMKNNMATEGIPSFTFGSKGAGTVFSFAAISSNANIDTTSPKFHFGSNNKCLSFMW